MDRSGMSKRRKTSRNRGGLGEDDNASVAPSSSGAAGDGERSRGGTPSNRTRRAGAKGARDTEGAQKEASALHQCVAKLKRCSHDPCERRPSFSVEGSKKAAYCKEHAHEGMVDVVHKRCSRDACKRRPTFGIEGSKTDMYCRRHAADGMVDVVSKRCSHDSCKTAPRFNAEGRKSGAYCKAHAGDGMVNVVDKRCLNDSCKRRPTFNMEGSRTAVCCKQHAEDGMVDVYNKVCSHDSCKRRPTFNMEGSRTAVCCKLHAEEGMVNVIWILCSHDSCTKKPSWGILTNRAPTVCATHKKDLLDGPVISFRKHCKVAGCVKDSTWGPDGKQPTHCRDHGPSTEGIVCTVGLDRSEVDFPMPFSRALKAPSHAVKTECLF